MSAGELMRTVIIQRTIPHYRVPLFRRLHEELGWIVATSDEQHPNDGLAVELGAAPWIRRFPFERRSQSSYDVGVPLDRILGELEPDAIVSEFSLQMSSTWQLARLARSKRRPRVVFWSQGWNHERGFRTPKDLASQILRLRLMRAADGHVCYTQAGANYLRRFMPKRAGIFVATNTIDMEPSALPDADMAAAPAASPTLLFVGRLTRDKRVPLLVAAARLARRKLPDLHLRIIGDGPDLPRVRAAAAGADDWIDLLGSIYDSGRLAAEYRAASLLVYAGSIGLAANEALAHGLPVMLFDRPPRGAYHHPEHAYVLDGVTGYRVAGTGAEALAERIVDVLSSPPLPRQALAPNIARIVRNDLSLDHMVEGFRELSAWLGAHPPSARRAATAAFVWDNLGPMHDDRCKAVAAALGSPHSVAGIELYSTSDTYTWPSPAGDGYRKVTLADGAQRSKLRLFANTARLVRACRASGAATIFLCHYERPEIFFAAVLLRLSGRRVLTMGDMKYDDKKRMRWLEALKHLAMWPYQGAIAASPRTADYMKALGIDPAAICLGYDNISLERIRRAAEPFRDCAFDERSIVSIARLVPKKNHRVLIDAFAEYVAQVRSPRRLVLCGSGPLERDIRSRIAELGLAAHVDMLGFVGAGAVASQLKRALCLVLPSVEEQFGIVILEALALGIPVIVSTNCGARDLSVRNGVNGFVIEPHDSTTLASLLARLGDDELLWKRLSREALHIADLGDVRYFASSAVALLGGGSPGRPAGLELEPAGDLRQCA
jgi:glycosyltransferase involved in cell wall biosynthesis